MIDYKNELGRVLEKILVAINSSAEPVSRNDIAKLFNVSNRIATDYIQALYNRRYIMDFRGDWKDTDKQESKFVVAVGGYFFLQCSISHFNSLCPSKSY